MEEKIQLITHDVNITFDNISEVSTISKVYDEYTKSIKTSIYENFLKMLEDEQEVNINLAYNMYNNRLNNDDYGFVNPRLNYRFVHTGQKRTINWVLVNKDDQLNKRIEYTLKNKIKYYKQRVNGVYNGQKLSDGQVSYARKFLAMNGVDYK